MQKAIVISAGKNIITTTTREDAMKQIASMYVSLIALTLATMPMTIVAMEEVNGDVGFEDQASNNGVQGNMVAVEDGWIGKSTLGELPREKLVATVHAEQSKIANEGGDFERSVAYISTQKNANLIDLDDNKSADTKASANDGTETKFSINAAVVSSARKAEERKQKNGNGLRSSATVVNNPENTKFQSEQVTHEVFPPFSSNVKGAGTGLYPTVEPSTKQSVEPVIPVSTTPVSELQTPVQRVTEPTLGVGNTPTPQPTPMPGQEPDKTVPTGNTPSVGNSPKPSMFQRTRDTVGASAGYVYEKATNVGAYAQEKATNAKTAVVNRLPSMPSWSKEQKISGPINVQHTVVNGQPVPMSVTPGTSFGQQDDEIKTPLLESDENTSGADKDNAPKAGKSPALRKGFIVGAGLAALGGIGYMFTSNNQPKSKANARTLLKQELFGCVTRGDYANALRLVKERNVLSFLSDYDIIQLRKQVEAALFKQKNMSGDIAEDLFFQKRVVFAEAAASSGVATLAVAGLHRYTKTALTKNIARLGAGSTAILGVCAVYGLWEKSQRDAVPSNENCLYEILELIPAE